MSFNARLINLLKTDPRFVDDEGELVLAAMQDRAWKTDRDLVKLLLSDKDGKGENVPSAGSGQGIEKQKRLLAELFGKNQLYVNLSEINDTQFNVREEDKVLNKVFYGGAL